MNDFFFETNSCWIHKLDSALLARVSPRNQTWVWRGSQHCGAHRMLGAERGHAWCVVLVLVLAW